MLSDKERLPSKILLNFMLMLNLIGTVFLYIRTASVNVLFLQFLSDSFLLGFFVYGFFLFSIYFFKFNGLIKKILFFSNSLFATTVLWKFFFLFFHFDSFYKYLSSCFSPMLYSKILKYYLF